MIITVRYGNDLDVGAGQFPELDEQATNAEYVSLVREHLASAFPNDEVHVTYSEHQIFSQSQRLFVEDGDDTEVEEVLNTIENEVLGGIYGEYAVEAKS